MVRVTMAAKAMKSVAALSGMAGLLAVSGCASISSALKDGSDASIEISPVSDQATAAAPVHSPIVVKASQGTLVNVAVAGPKGPLAGTMNESRTQWTSNNDTLAFGAQYSVTAAAVDDGGTPVERAVELRTVKPKKTIDGQFNYFMNNATVGVGMPIRIEFSQAVKNRAAVEKRLVVTSTKPTSGAWSWDADGTAVTFRPQGYWPARAKIKVDASLKGIEMAPGVYGERDMAAGFKTGSSMVSVVDANTLMMTVRRDGKVIRQIPVTTGKAGFETRSGIKPIMGKEGTVIMDAASGGTPRTSSEYYRLTVHQAMRLTPSGEFVHAAPWSVGSQGRASVSHGCVGMSSSNAAWFYSVSQVGDLVVVKNTGRKQDLGNGITEWNISWNKWLARSKTGEQPVQAPIAKKALATAQVGPSATATPMG